MPVPGWTSPPRPGRRAMIGRFVRLDPLVPAMAPGLHAANAEDAAGRMWDFLPYGPFRDGDAYAAWVAEVAARDDPLFFQVTDLDTGMPGGVLSLLRIDPGAGSIEVGHIAFAPRLQRTRAATEAVWLVMAGAFAAGYRRFEWKCNALNIPSRRAALRFGLSFEGVFRNHLVVKGRNRDTAWYAAIDSEAPALQAAYSAWLDPANFDPAGRQRESLAVLTDPILVARG